MVKTVTFKCNKCGKDHTFTIGACDIATLQDAVDKLPDRDAEKLLEAVNRMLMNKSEAQRTSFMTINKADALSMINYDLCGQSLTLFNAEETKALYAKYTPDQIDRLNKSMAMWSDALNSDGFIAFNAIYYCRKCKKLTQGMFLKVRSVEDKKERTYMFNQKCQTCNSELTLVNEANMGFMFEGLTARAPCPDCGGKITATEIKYKS
ncbi:MAG: hypothetical protein HDT28_08200 [Clostridiales bacterium]|nr:hypothetical protein [Clostridiales bacterium]